MSLKQLGLWWILVDFCALTVYAIFTEGYFAFLGIAIEFATSSMWGAQILGAITGVVGAAIGGSAGMASGAIDQATYDEEELLAMTADIPGFISPTQVSLRLATTLNTATLEPSSRFTAIDGICSMVPDSSRPGNASTETRTGIPTWRSGAFNGPAAVVRRTLSASVKSYPSSWATCQGIVV